MTTEHYDPYMPQTAPDGIDDDFRDGVVYPGELTGIPKRFGETVTDAEVIGNIRSRYRANFGRGSKGAGGPPKLPRELPALDANRELMAIKIPPRILAVARAKSDAERRTLTSIVEEVLAAYAASPMGAEPKYELPKR